jgi:altronate dehydratase
MGHKFALKDMGEGEAIIKYGEPIGQSTVKISRGEHVHVHNVISQPR